MTDTRPLRLIALDTEDLQVLSAHLQDAVLRVGDMAYVPGQNKFAAVANRFDWERAADGAGTAKDFARRRAALRFDRVLGAQVQNIRLGAQDTVLELLAIRFEEGTPPEGHITLVFAGGGAVRLHVECIEAELRDLGPSWQTRRKPEHGEDGRPRSDG